MEALGHIKSPAVYRLGEQNVLVPQIQHDRREVGNQSGCDHEHDDRKQHTHIQHIVAPGYNEEDQHQAKQ
ncbi:hypothetical protein D3C76_1634910 [compost metagenome]